MISTIKNRLSGEQGFTLVELLIVMIVLGILVVVAVPSYLGFRLKAEKAAAKSNVSSAINAAAVYFYDVTAAGGNGSYAGLTKAKLILEAPGVSTHVRAGGNAVKFCIEDTEGSAGYYYEGGLGGTAALTFGLCAVGYAVA